MSEPLLHRGRADRGHQGPGRADRGALGQAAGSSAQAGQPGQQAQAVRSSSSAPAWPAARPAATLAELGYQVKSVLLPGQPAPRAQHRRAGRHQRGEELPQRRRQRPPALLRHGQGRRLPVPRVQRPPARRRSAVEIIDQCVAQGVPFAREYGGLLDTRSFGGAQVSRTFYARGQTGQQLLLGAYQALERQIAAGTVEMFTRARDARPDRRRRPRRAASSPATWSPARSRRTSPTPSCWPPAATATSSTCRPTPRAATSPRPGGRTSKGALFANPCYTQIHPTCIPVSGEHQSKLTLMSRVAAQRRPGLGAGAREATHARPATIPEDERDYYLERIYPTFGNLVPRDIASRAAKNVCDEGRGVGPGGLRRLPRLRRRDRAARPRRRRGEVRQPLRDVRAHHRRGPVRGADAHLPGRALHDGRPVGRLRPASPPSRACS